MKRKPIPKNIRFEVFKRDSFKCQYCGSSAPESILHIDHIKPVSRGGDNDLTNLITACDRCNLGKSNKELSDDSILKKQHAQLEELNERRIQLEMMLEWRQSLENFEDKKVQSIVNLIEQKGSCHLNEHGISSVRKWLRKFKLDYILQAIDTSSSQYLEYGDDDEVTEESIDKYFNYIPRIASTLSTSEKDPQIKDLYYIRGILRNRLPYLNEWFCLDVLRSAVSSGVEIDHLYSLARNQSIGSWSKFRDCVYELMEECD